jgi:hypothetical protein
MSIDNKKCADLIKDQYESRSEDLVSMLAAIEAAHEAEAWDELEDAETTLDQSFLDISLKEVAYQADSQTADVVVLLSTGGPHEEVRIRYHATTTERNRFNHPQDAWDNCAIESIDFFFSDWFDSADLKVLRITHSEGVVRYGRDDYSDAWQQLAYRLGELVPMMACEFLSD